MSGRFASEGDESLRIPEDQLWPIRRHAEAAYPNECCGVLIGVESGSDVRVRRAVPTVNGSSNRVDRYEIPPEELLKAIDSARARRESIVGYYHSHPDRPARPSCVDRRDAWPGVSYVIVSVEDGVATQVRSWRLTGNGDFFEESVVSQGSLPRPAVGKFR